MPVPKALVDQLTQERDRILLSNMCEASPCHRKALGGGFNSARYRPQAAQGAQHSPKRQALREQQSQPRRPSAPAIRKLKQQFSSTRSPSHSALSNPRQEQSCRMLHGHAVQLGNRGWENDLLESFCVDELSPGGLHKAGSLTQQRAAQVIITCKSASAEQPAAARAWYSPGKPLSATRRPASAACWPPGSFRPTSATVRESASASWNIPARPRSAVDPRSRASAEAQASSAGAKRPGTAHATLSFNRSCSGSFNGSFNGRSQPHTVQRSPSLDMPRSQNGFRSGRETEASPQSTIPRPVSSHVASAQHTHTRPKARGIHSAPPQRMHVKAYGVAFRPASAMDGAAVDMNAGEHKDFCPSYSLKFALGMVLRDTGCIDVANSRRVLQEYVPFLLHAYVCYSEK